MGFAEAVSTCFAKYFTFAGRARRSEYWYFYLFFVICSVAAAIVDVMLGTLLFDDNGEFAGGLILLLAIFALFIPQLSVSVRRLHDIDLSGWWWWVSLIPLVGPILVLVWACTPGTEGDNSYGSDPRHQVAASVFD